MKNFLIISQIALVLFSCSPKEVEKVEGTFDDGKPKFVCVYKNIDGIDVKVKEKELYENGKVRMEGAIKDGKRDGIWNVYFDDGKLWSEGTFTNGKRNGVAKNYFPNGKLRYEGFFTDDSKSGHWKFYGEDGTLLEEKDF
jgi:antitoxin component YwqK of YwqJK toxin-antitoxin module